MIIPNLPDYFEQNIEPQIDIFEEQSYISSTITNLFPDIDEQIKIFHLDFPTPKNNKDNVTSYIDNPKHKHLPLFTINKVKNRPILESEINELFKKINIIEKDFFLNSSGGCEEIEKIRNKLKLNKNIDNYLPSSLKINNINDNNINEDHEYNFDIKNEISNINNEFNINSYNNNSNINMNEINKNTFKVKNIGDNSINLAELNKRIKEST